MNRLSILGTVLVLLTVAGCSAPVAGSPSGSPSGVPPSLTPSPIAPPATTKSSSAPIATRTPPVSPVAAFHLEQRGGTAFSDGSVWMAGGGDLLRIDPKSSKVLASIAIGGTGKFVFAGEHSIWVSRAGTFESGTTENSTVRVNPATNRVSATVPFGVAFGFGSLWGIDPEGHLVRGDPATGRVIASVAIQGPIDWQPQLAMGFGSVWVASGDTKSLFRVDPVTMQITATIGPLTEAYSLLAVGIGFDSVWANANAASPHGSGKGTGMLYRIDPTSNGVVASIAVGDQGDSRGYGATVIGIGEGSVWTGDSDVTLTRVDPSTNTVLAIRDLAAPPEFVAAGYGSVWLNDQQFRAGDWTP